MPGCKYFVLIEYPFPFALNRHKVKTFLHDDSDFCWNFHSNSTVTFKSTFTGTKTEF